MLSPRVNMPSVNWLPKSRPLKQPSGTAAGDSVGQLAQQFDLCQPTIRNYIKAYNKEGIQTLRPQKPPGRPKKVGQLGKDDWGEILSRTPNQYDKLQTDSRQWTLELLVGYAKAYLDAESVFEKGVRG